MYKFYVDESGDPNTSKFRTDARKSGATPFMVLGGVLVKESDTEIVQESIKGIKEKIRKDDLHCRGLSHLQKRCFAQSVAKLDVTLFGIVSLSSRKTDHILTHIL